MGRSNYVHLEGCDIIRETDSAFLVRYDDEQIWFPKSQIAGPDDYEEGDCDVTLSVTEFIAGQKGIDT